MIDIYRVVISVSLICIYYGLIKSTLHKLSPKIVCYFAWETQHALNALTSVVKLSLITLSHLVFCIITAHLLVPNAISISLFSLPSLRRIFFSLLLGIGLFGCAALMGRCVLTAYDHLTTRNTQNFKKSRSKLLNSGWLRHYLDTLAVLPFPLALALCTCQLASEEMMFRAILFYYFLPQGQVTYIVISTLLFTSMQLFQMPSLRSAILPMMGALIMGMAHATLYTQMHQLLPLILSHAMFFTFAIL